MFRLRNLSWFLPLAATGVFGGVAFLDQAVLSSDGYVADGAPAPVVTKAKAITAADSPPAPHGFHELGTNLAPTPEPLPKPRFQWGNADRETLPPTLTEPATLEAEHLRSVLKRKPTLGTSSPTAKQFPTKRSGIVAVEALAPPTPARVTAGPFENPRLAQQTSPKTVAKPAATGSVGDGLPPAPPARPVDPTQPNPNMRSVLTPQVAAPEPARPEGMPKIALKARLIGRGKAVALLEIEGAMYTVHEGSRVALPGVGRGELEITTLTSAEVRVAIQPANREMVIH